MDKKSRKVAVYQELPRNKKQAKSVHGIGMTIIHSDGTLKHFILGKEKPNKM